MKSLKTGLVLFFIGIVSQAYSQTDKETTQRIVANKNYTFVANSANPLSSADIAKVLNSIPGSLGGSFINLSGSGYTLRVNADSVISYLPYYGRSYQAPINPSEGGIKFTSTDFKYESEKGRKGSYNINIDTKDNKGENYSMVLSITRSGYATLVVRSVYRQPITFQGYMKE